LLAAADESPNEKNVLIPPNRLANTLLPVRADPRLNPVARIPQPKLKLMSLKSDSRLPPMVIPRADLSHTPEPSLLEMVEDATVVPSTFPVA